MMMMEEETVMMAALSALTLSQLSDLSRSVLSMTLHHHFRLSTLLSSPSLFHLTLGHLHSLSLQHKTLLIARHLLSSLHHLTRHFQPPPPPHPSTTIKQRDLDAALLLLLLCETHQYNPEALETPHTEWRDVLSKRYFDKHLLALSGIGWAYDGAVLIPYIELVTRCIRFVAAMGCGGKEGREVGASPAAVVALPAVEVRGGGGGGIECVICKEEMREGRDACELPCEHSFHWICILPWLKKRNTCPCCRFQLPSDDAYSEIERLWGLLVQAGGRR